MSAPPVKNEEGTELKTSVGSDFWSSKKYSASASFVPLLTSDIVNDYLCPKPGDRILDIGCGDGILTTKIAKQVRVQLEGEENDGTRGYVLGLDASPSMIKSASLSAADEGVKNVRYQTQDCTTIRFSDGIPDCPTLIDFPVLDPESFDKVFSNAALHWILSQSSTRETVFRSIYRALKSPPPSSPSSKSDTGILAFEMGGAGNVAEIHAGIRAILSLKYGLPYSAIDEAFPWFFPSCEWMTEMLTTVGFVVDRCELVHRPTRLTDGRDGGLAGWLRLFGTPFFKLISDPVKREEAVQDVVALLDPVVKREDGSRWVNYVRLRVLARKISSQGGSSK